MLCQAMKLELSLDDC